VHHGHHDRPSARNGADGRPPPARGLYIDAVLLIRRKRPRRKMVWGRRNPLKKLDSDKEIKGFPLIFFDPIWPGLGKFGFGLEKPSWRRPDCLMRAVMSDAGASPHEGARQAQAQTKRGAGPLRVAEKGAQAIERFEQRAKLHTSGGRALPPKRSPAREALPPRRQWTASSPSKPMEYPQ
jgi:hypothetical protein